MSENGSKLDSLRI